MNARSLREILKTTHSHVSLLSPGPSRLLTNNNHIAAFEEILECLGRGGAGEPENGVESVHRTQRDAPLAVLDGAPRVGLWTTLSVGVSRTLAIDEVALL